MAMFMLSLQIDNYFSNVSGSKLRPHTHKHFHDSQYKAHKLSKEKCQTGAFHKEIQFDEGVPIHEIHDT